MILILWPFPDKLAGCLLDYPSPFVPTCASSWEQANHFHILFTVSYCFFGCPLFNYFSLPIGSTWANRCRLYIPHVQTT